MDQVMQALEHGGAGADRDRIAIVWSEARREELRLVGRGGSAPRAAVDVELAGPMLHCADGRFEQAERTILDLLRRHADACRDDNETFISFLNAAFTVQRFDVVSALLRTRHGFARDLEIAATRDDAIGQGLGRGQVRWEIGSSGAHRFVFDAEVFRRDDTRTDILAFHWGFPVYANYSRSADQETGRIVINQQDIGVIPGLAWCENRPDYFLVPDCIFVPTRGYADARRVIGERRAAWQDRAPVAFWRGATTGIPAAPGDWRSLERIKLCELARRHARTGLFDAGISSVVQFDDPRVAHKIRQSGLLLESVPWQEWGRYKYLIDIDGNSSPWSNLFQRLLTGSTVLKVESSRGLRQWYYDELEPWGNYVPVAPDLSDLVDKTAWLERNDSAARRIGEAGLSLAERLTYEREIGRSAAVISSAFRYFNGRPEGIGPFGRSWGGEPTDDVPPPPAGDPFERKRLIEAGFDRDRSLEARQSYIAALQEIDRTFCGTLEFRWPGVDGPLFMRCGSSDLSNFIQIFSSEEYGFLVESPPARILDLGAYAGYAATYLAARFPRAEIVCVEPSPGNFRVLTLNTARCDRIRRLNVAVWGHSSTLNVAGYAGGDWGTLLAEGDVSGAAVPALSVADILARVGWPSADFLKCDIEGSEFSVFSESGDLIAGMVDCCAIETHDVAAPGTSRLVEGCFDQRDFTHDRSGEFKVFRRRGASRASPPAATLSVLRPSNGVRRIHLSNVPAEPWAYYMFDEDSCQLHPNDPGQPHAELSTVIDLAGQAAFTSDVTAVSPFGHAIDFMIRVTRISGGQDVATATASVEAGHARRWIVPLEGPAHGPHLVVLQTAMSSSDATSHQVVANWVAPAFGPR